MGRVRRHGAGPLDLSGLVAEMPDRLRSFTAWKDGTGGGPAPGLIRYRMALRYWLENRLGCEVDDDTVTTVQHAAIGNAESTAEWFRVAFGRPTGLRVIDGG